MITGNTYQPQLGKQPVKNASRSRLPLMCLWVQVIMSAAVVHVIGDAWVYECLFKVNLTHQQTCLRVIFNLLFWLSTGGGEHDTNEAETHKGGLRGYAVHMTWHNQICWPILHFKIPCNMRVCVCLCVCVFVCVCCNSSSKTCTYKHKLQNHLCLWLVLNKSKSQRGVFDNWDKGRTNICMHIDMYV